VNLRFLAVKTTVLFILTIRLNLDFAIHFLHHKTTAMNRQTSTDLVLDARDKRYVITLILNHAQNFYAVNGVMISALQAQFDSLAADDSLIKAVAADNLNAAVYCEVEKLACQILSKLCFLP
jgi:hypothetical protein